MRHPLLPASFAALIACACLPVPRAQAAPAATAAAPLPGIAYQGLLAQGGAAANGDYTFVFSILDSSGTEQWNSGPRTLAVTDGLFSTVLGSDGMNVIPAAVLALGGLALHITVAGQPLAPDVALLPAFQAQGAWTLLGTFGGDLAGTQEQTRMVELQGFPLDLTSTPPTSGQVLLFNGSQWIPASVPSNVGPVGPQGPAGPAGATGPRGPQGSAGPAGAQGPAGLAGVSGPVGAPGPAGANGRNANAVLSGAGSPVPGNPGDPGDFYLDTSNNLLYGPKPASGWSAVLPVALAGLPGSQGPAGAAGAPGATGSAGGAGPVGGAGLPGSQGPPGALPWTLTGNNVVYTAGAMGLGTAAPNSDALLEIASANQGLLPPRVQLAGTASPAPLSAHVAGMLVWNTATAGNVTPGLYFDNGSAWVAVLMTP